ncbi:pentapeptide repeat-containing protein [Kiloniella sp. b19]|uniref:pentapeptide repeat-containing protein n=1 Tax=Kiloniella sp. GXU_MW_B19 TaxID=3141326 RepID=UPI0031D8D48D
MKSFIRFCCVMFSLFAVSAAIIPGFSPFPVRSALAACTDPPEPGVNWQRCLMNSSQLDAVDLTGAKLRDNSQFRSILDQAVLRDVDGFRAKFVNASMIGADLENGRFSEADFTKADLSQASLKNADLRRAKLFRAILRGADLSGARLSGADIGKADFSGATWTDGQKVCAEGSIGRCK